MIWEIRRCKNPSPFSPDQFPPEVMTSLAFQEEKVTKAEEIAVSSGRVSKLYQGHSIAVESIILKKCKGNFMTYLLYEGCFPRFCTVGAWAGPPCGSRGEGGVAVLAPSEETEQP